VACGSIIYEPHKWRDASIHRGFIADSSPLASIESGAKIRPMKRGETMARRSTWHSTWSEVYHDNTECNTGNNIENEYRTLAASPALRR
jgi:hypothetical protein